MKWEGTGVGSGKAYMNNGVVACTFMGAIATNCLTSHYRMAKECRAQ